MWGYNNLLLSLPLLSEEAKGLLFTAHKTMGRR
jgi:hypothetical protein